MVNIDLFGIHDAIYVGVKTKIARRGRGVNRRYGSIIRIAFRRLKSTQ